MEINFEQPKSFDEWKQFEEFRYHSAKNISYMIRDEFISHVGYHITTTEQIKYLCRLLNGKRVVEVGCGSGWLLSQLRSNGVDAIGVDDVSRQYGIRNGKYCSDSILNKEASNYLSNNANYDAVIMAWPCYDTSFAYDVAESLKSGTLLLYEGESIGGCTGTDDFFDLIFSDLFLEMKNETIELNKYHRNFDGIHDYWHVFKKK